MKYLRPCILFVMIALAALESLSASTKPPLRVAITAPTLTEQEILRVNVAIHFLAPAEMVRVHIQGSGSLELRAFEDEARGSWQAGDVYSFALDARPVAEGEGILTVAAEATRMDGAVIQRSARLYGLVEGQTIWTSPSSPTDLRFRRIEHLRGTSAITAEQRIALLEAVVTARAQVDDRPRPIEDLTPHQKALQRIYAPALLPDKGLQPLPSPAAVNLTVQGKVEWTDRTGGRHGLPLATVEIRDSDLVGSDLVATVQTDMAGNYSAAVNHDDGLLQGNPDIFVRVLARSPAAEIKPDGLFASTYRLESPVQDEVADGSTLTLNLTAGNAADSETAFSVHHALVVIGGYAGGLAGVMPSRVEVRFPTNEDTSQFKGGKLHILRDDRWDWDVIHHEYGHYFMSIHKFEDNPGGNHGFNDNLAQTRGSKSVGIRLAWGEGWPTFFGTAGQSVTGASSLGVPDVGDTRYQDTEDATTNLNLETSQGVGEDNEVSVMAALWDLFDSASDGEDNLSFSDRRLFNLVKVAGAKTVGAAWEAIAAAQDTRNKTLVGAVLGQSNIAPELAAPADKIKVSAGGTPPTFEWQKNGGGTPNPLNDFKIVFYNHDFSTKVFEKDLGDVDSFTPTAAELGTILGSGTPVKWVVEGKNTSTPATPGGALDRYWSGSRTLGGVQIAFVIDDTGSMTEEIAGVRNALQAFIDHVAAGLPPGAEPPTIELVTFKDDVTSRIVSNDLAAVRAQVNTLTASGGGDCPEFSAQALQYAATNITPGGTILLATDASSQPGVDAGALIARLRAAGVRVNTILSGDCSGIGSPLSVKRRTRNGAANVFDSSQSPQPQEKKPGAEDPPQDPIDDPGQEPFDDHGDTPETATPLPTGIPPVRGVLQNPAGDIDLFRLSLQAGVPVGIDFQREEGGSLAFVLLDRDGITELDSAAFFDELPHRILFIPEEAGDYFLRAEGSTFDVAAVYNVALRDDAFVHFDSAVELFSTISAQTGGAFLVRDEVNFGDPASFEAALFNVLLSTVEPAVLAGEPRDLPRGVTLGVQLIGRGTNWRSGSSVHFSGTGLEVLSLEVHSSTQMTALVRVDPGAALGSRDVEVSTPLGETMETARGRSVIRVVSSPSGPALVSVEPAVLAQGESRSILIRGFNTSWTASSVVSLGPGITITSSTLRSPTEIVAQIQVAPQAEIGFRTASVVTSGAGTQSKFRALFVGAAALGLPEISALDPAMGAAGRTVTVMVTGSSTNFVAGVTTASFGEGITVLSVNVIDALHATVTLRIEPGAAPGFRDVSLTTGSETAVLLGGFFVEEQQAEEIADIPALSSLGLILLIGALVAGGIVQLRKQRRHV
jgi:Quinohemoprotein amine dehydrogenase, alpha subunit domain III